MTMFDFDAESRAVVLHYRDLVRQYPAQVEAWREQARALTKAYPVEWAGLEDRVREALHANSP